MKLFISLFFVIFTCLFVSNLHAGRIYVWTDEKGIKHFSDNPPPKKAKGIKVLKFQERKDEAKKDEPNLDVSKLKEKEMIEGVRDMLLKEKGKGPKIPMVKEVKGVGYDLKDVEKLLGTLRNVGEHYHIIWMFAFLLVALFWFLIWVIRRALRPR
ncbi:MAG: DUF4124 domain-containing protein [Pseudomonadota bacterium]